MHLIKLKIENFRGIRSVELSLDRTTVLIGENNSGKSTILEALNLAINRTHLRRASPFDEYDHYLESAAADPTLSPPLIITILFSEDEKDEWPEELIQVLDKAVQVRATDGLQQITFQVKSSYDKTLNEFVVEWAFLDLLGNPLTGARNPRLVSELQQLNPVFLLEAVRDAGQHFNQKSSYWAPFLRNLKMSDTVRKELEEQIEEVNQAVINSHAPLGEVKNRLEQAGKLLPLGSSDIVSVEAVPAKIGDVLSRTQLKLASRTGAKMPVTQHGAGTQSLAVLFLFEAFLNARLTEAYGKNTDPLIAIEEPEAHLHPSAIRSLWTMLDALKGQKLIATHSGDLLSAVPLKAIRRLARKNGEVKAYQLGNSTLDEHEERKLKYHINVLRGSLLFAKCWLLAEGESEFWLLPVLAELCGYDLELQGVSCVCYAECGIECLIKVARDFGIEWHCLTDGDAQGEKNMTAAKKYLATDKLASRITSLVEQDLEHCLWAHGYEKEYETNVTSNQRSTVKSKVGSPDYISDVIRLAKNTASKPSLAVAVAGAAKGRGIAGVPPKLKLAIEQAVKLARTAK